MYSKVIWLYAYIFFSFFYLVYYSILNVVPHKPQLLSTGWFPRAPGLPLTLGLPRNSACHCSQPAHPAVMQAPFSLWPSHLLADLWRAASPVLRRFPRGTCGAHVLSAQSCVSSWPGPVLQPWRPAGGRPALTAQVEAHSSAQALCCFKGESIKESLQMREAASVCH